MSTNNEAIKILPKRPDSEEAIKLIGELEDFLVPLYPSESRHGFSVEKLISEKVAFFVLRYNGAPAGCGGSSCSERNMGRSNGYLSARNTADWAFPS